MAYRIIEYIEDGHSPFAEWFNRLDPVMAARINRYVRRLEAGNFGAAKFLCSGVFELRMDFGPGYRVYYGRDGKDTNSQEENKNMALTRKYKKTVMERIKRDPRFAKALYTEAVNAILEGETGEGLSMLRDLIHAEITFPELARQTGFNEKSLHRMLSRRGNPTTRTFAVIIRAMSQDLKVAPKVKFAVA